jgi:hypothetical protein
MTDETNTSPIPELSLRDWFAGQALAGMCSAPAIEGETWKDFATRAYLAADTMLMVREQTEGSHD